MSGSIDISQLTPASSSSPTDLLPVTQGSIGPATGTTKSVTPLLLMNQTQVVAPAVAATGMASLTRATSSTQADLPILKTQWTITDTGGAAHNQTFNKTYVTTLPGEFWANFDDLEYSGPGTSGAGIVTRYIQATSTTDRHADTLLWALVTSVVDGTEHAAATSGGMLVHEIDMEASGLANGTGNGGSRRGLAVVGFKGRDYGGTDTEFNIGISVFATTNTRFKNHINCDGNFNDACILLNGTSESSAPHLAIKTGGLLSFDYASGNHVTLSSFYLGTSGCLSLSAPMRLKGYTVAQIATLDGDLTSAAEGTMVWCSNCIGPDTTASGAVCVVNHVGTIVTTFDGLAPHT